MKMNIIDKIDIEEISSNYQYATMALLVDQDAFIEDVRSARKSLGLIEPMSCETTKEWLSHKYKTTSIPRMDEVDKKFHKRNFMLLNTIEYIKIKFHKNRNYAESIKYAILTGKITDKEFTSELFCEPYPFSEEFEEAELFHEEPVVAIFVNPETKIEEVKKLMDTEVKELFKEMQITYRFPRESKNIRRDRKWFWLKRIGKSYQQIADLEEMKLDSLREVVIKAVQQYKRRLDMES